MIIELGLQGVISTKKAPTSEGHNHIKQVNNILSLCGFVVLLISQVVSYE